MKIFIFFHPQLITSNSEEDTEQVFVTHRKYSTRVIGILLSAITKLGNKQRHDLSTNKQLEIHTSERI